MPWLILVIIILGIGTFTMTTKSSVRGIRINNPLNIRIAANAWQGKITPSRDSTFETFKAPQWGFRAGAILLRNYQLRHEHHGSGTPLHKRPSSPRCRTGLNVNENVNGIVN